MNGVEKAHGVGTLNAYEKGRLDEAMAALRKEIDTCKASRWFRKLLASFKHINQFCYTPFSLNSFYNALFTETDKQTRRQIDSHSESPKKKEIDTGLEFAAGLK